MDILVEPPTLDPSTEVDTTSKWVLDQTMEGLTNLGKDNTSQPGIAKSWKTSTDGKVWTFTLRDAKWTNGDPVTAGDFVFAIKHALDPNTAAQNASYLYYINGAKEYNSGHGSADNVGVKAVDDHTLEFTLNNPVPFFLGLTTLGVYLPQDAKVAQKNPKWYADASTFVSDGPFSLQSWKHQQKLVMVKNPTYWNSSSVQLKQINAVIVNDSNTQYQMYKSGQLDMDTQLPLDLMPNLMKTGDATILPFSGTYMVEMNVNKPPFNNPDIRKAFAMAIDRKQIVNDVLQGGQIPAFAIVPPGLPGKDGPFRKEGGDLVKEDVAQAKALLAKGMQAEGITQLPPITYQYNTLEYNKKIAEALQQMWKQNLGADVKLQNEDWKVYLDTMKKGNFQMGRMGWIDSYQDPTATLDLFKANFGSNYMQWNNPQYTALVNAAENTMDVSKRMADMHQAEQILMNDMPALPIYFYTNVFAFNKKLQGTVVLPSQSMPDMRFMSVN